MRLKSVQSTLQSLLPTKQPVILWGPPGIGKSQIIAQTAKAMGIDLIDVRAVLLDPVDLRGLPHVENGVANWATPGFLPKQGTKKAGILLLDEIDKAPPLVQNACLQLTLDRMIGEYVLPDNWYVMAAANRIQDGAGGHKMGTALSSRFLHLDVEVRKDDWLEWAMNAGIHGSILGYVQMRGEDVLHPHKENKDGKRKLTTAQDRTFPCPRTWEFVSRVVDKVPQESVREVVAGCIGSATTAEYLNFLDTYRSLPDPEALLRDPDNAVMPEEPHVLYALTGFLTEKINDADDDTIKRIVKLLRKMRRENAMHGVMECVSRSARIVKSSEMTNWLQEDEKMTQMILGSAS